MPRTESIAEQLFGRTAAEERCPNCAIALVEDEVTEEIPVDGGRSIRARVPVLRCTSCDFAITTDGAEAIRDAAVRLHRGLLTAAEIRAIRDNLGYSRREFSEAFGLPAASMERWENGRLIQTRSNDTLLRALANKATAAALDRRRLKMAATPVLSTGSVVPFKALAADAPTYENALARSQKFSLRKM